jgi:hypothetical protein
MKKLILLAGLLLAMGCTTPENVAEKEVVAQPVVLHIPAWMTHTYTMTNYIGGGSLSRQYVLFVTSTSIVTEKLIDYVPNVTPYIRVVNHSENFHKQYYNFKEENYIVGEKEFYKLSAQDLKTNQYETIWLFWRRPLQPKYICWQYPSDWTLFVQD